MAAGLGFKDFVTGEVLTAADVDGYLMQGTWVFANATARTAAVTSPQEGNMSYLKDTDSVEYYTGSAWVAVGGTPATPGSTYVGGATFSASSSTSVNDVFSSTYQNYKIVLNFTSSVSDNIYMRLRVSGTDNTTSNYETQNAAISGTSVSANLDTALSFFVFNGMGANPNNGDVLLCSPFETAKTHFVNTGLTRGRDILIKGGNFTSTTSFTGFTIYPSSGNITGTVRVYGLANS